MRALALAAIVTISACAASSPFVEDPGPLPGDSLYSSLVPLPAMGTGDHYQGLDGGLFGSASNSPGAEHQTAGMTAAAAVQPNQGRVVFLGLGMSNADQELQAFERLVRNSVYQGDVMGAARVSVSGNVAIVNGARGSATAAEWLESDIYDVLVDALEGSDLSAADVQVAWVKLANGTAVSRESGLLPDADADAWILATRCLAVMDTLAGRFPNLRQVFLSSRTFGGHAPSGTGEPTAYETGFGIRRCILEYDGRLFVTWGPYLWDPTWPPSDFEDDGRHPSSSGEAKVAARLQSFLDTSPYTDWWRRRR